MLEHGCACLAGSTGWSKLSFRFAMPAQLPLMHRTIDVSCSSASREAAVTDQEGVLSAGRDLTYAVQGISGQTSDLPVDLSLQSAVATNSSGLVIQSLLNTYSTARCQTSCNSNCQAYTAGNGAKINYDNYIQAGNTGTCGCGFLWLGSCPSYDCCIQVCDVDGDCPSSYFCQPGYPSPINAACTKCDACGTTTNAKCQSDQSCGFSCCLDTLYGIGGCYTGVVGNLYDTSPAACCPSDPSSSRLPYNYNKCSCVSQQTCPNTVTSPSPPTVPTTTSPAAEEASSPPPPPPTVTPAPVGWVSERISCVLASH